MTTIKNKYPCCPKDISEQFVKQVGDFIRADEELKNLFEPGSITIEMKCDNRLRSQVFGDPESQKVINNHSVDEQSVIILRWLQELFYKFAAFMRQILPNIKVGYKQNTLRMVSKQVEIFNEGKSLKLRWSWSYLSDLLRGQIEASSMTEFEDII